MKKIMYLIIAFLALIYVGLNIQYSDSPNISVSEKLEKELHKSSKNTSEINSDEYINHIDENTKEHLLDIAKEYYQSLQFLKLLSLEPTKNYNLYKNYGIEDKYSVGNILIFDAKVIIDNEEYIRTISIAKEQGVWQVINEGF